MNPTREEALFALALEKPVEKREAFLDVICEDDPALRRRLEALLAAHDQPDTALADSPTAERRTLKIEGAEAPDEAIGQTIGRYKLLENVGEGGCGVVYVAEQTEPVRRRVALKVIKLGMDTKQVVARFEAERQALAMMDHPNIAKVLDAGSTAQGRPYFVMELVRGIKITEYCDQEKISTQARLDLFVKVCHAIQHAHQKGIIHRDIKPSNILVTLHDGVPVPKVIDFGIAKATEGRLTDATVYTQLHQFIGTPAYMSPEQAEMSGLDIDTRSDIYSLGVLLYELLTGRTPFDGTELMSMGLDAMRKTIREKEPARPSTKLATLPGEDLTTTAKRRSVDTSKLLHQLRGDLDWIVMKCLEKDRTRRYESSDSLAADIQRHLGNEPVMARPPSTMYRLQKLVRRNKLVVVSGLAATGAMVLGLGLSTALYLRERQARLRANEAERAQASLRQEAEQRAEDGQKLGLAGFLLSQGRFDDAERIVWQVRRYPASAALYNALGTIHARRGEWQRALTNFSVVLELMPSEHEAYHKVAPLLVQKGATADYRRLCDQILQRFAGSTNATIAERMAKDCLILPPPAADLEAIGRMADTAVGAGPDHRAWAYFRFAKGLSDYRRGQFDAAEAVLQKLASEDLGANLRAEVRFVLAMTLHRLGKLAEAREQHTVAIEILNSQMAQAGKDDLGDNWTDWIIAHALSQEATSLIEPGGTK